MMALALRMFTRAEGHLLALCVGSWTVVTLLLCWIWGLARKPPSWGAHMCCMAEPHAPKRESYYVGGSRAHLGS